MTEIVEKTDTSSSQARSALSSSQFPFSKDCDPFLKWNEDPRDSGHEQAIVFRSLVATLQLQSALDDSLEAKAVRFLESMYLDDEDLAETFLSNFASFSGESLTNFVQSIVVLISSASNVITTAAMKMLKTLFSNCSPQVQLTLVKAELIPQLITTLNPQSVSLSDCQHIHTCLILCIINSVWLSTPYGLTSLEIEDRDEQQAVRETVFQQVLVPSEKYIWHLCKNRFSIIEREQSIAFMALLADLLQISPYYQPTMDLVQTIPVLLTIPSCLTFFENEISISLFLDYMIHFQREWSNERGNVRQMWKLMLAMLRMEGIEDVNDEMLLNNKNSDLGQDIIDEVIELNNLHGMNFPRL